MAAIHVKVLVTSDWHGDWVTRGVPRFKDIEDAVWKTVDVARSEKVDHYFFLGDLCDPDRNLSIFRCVELALMVAQRLREAEIDSSWLVGNHDVIEDGSGSSTLTPMHAGDGYLRERPGCELLVGGRRLLSLPFTPLSHTYDPVPYCEAELSTTEPLIVLSHLGVPGVQPGEETKEMPRGRDVLLPIDLLVQRKAPTIVFQGHFHKQQVFRDIVHIPGSLARLTFGEEDHTPGFLIVEW